MSFRKLAKHLPTIIVALALLSLIARPGIAAAAKVQPCGANQLRTTAYGAGLATGTEYYAVVITNTSLTRCRIGSEIALLQMKSRTLAKLAVTPGVVDWPMGKPLSELRAGQRAMVMITTTWAAEEYNDPDCPAGKGHPVDRVAALKLETGTISALVNPFDLERCLRRVSTLGDDNWLTRCEQDNPPCKPIPIGTYRPLMDRGSADLEPTI